MSVKAVRPWAIPDDCSGHQYKAFARRVTLAATLHAQRQASGRGYGGWADVPVVAIVFALRTDLRVESKGEDFKELLEQFLPGRSYQPTLYRFKEAMAADLPSFRAEFHRGPCPGPAGPKGGPCRRSGRVYTRRIIDMTTGAYEETEVCPVHLPAIRAAVAAAPIPPNNAGGVLRDVFPELDLADWYDRHQMKVGVEHDQSIDISPPKLRLIQGGAS